MNDKDQDAIDHIASVSNHPHAAMIVKQLITGWGVEFEYSTNEWKITDYPSWNYNSKYRLIEPKPDKPAYRVYKSKLSGQTFSRDSKKDGSRNNILSDTCEWISEWIEYDPPKKWPTPLVERIAKIDLSAAQWIVDHWDDLLDWKYQACVTVGRESQYLYSMFHWESSDQGTPYWYDISNKLGE